MNAQTDTASGPLKVLVSGYLGKMGSEVVRAVSAAPDLELVGGFDPACKQPQVLIEGEQLAPAFTDLTLALESTQPQVMVDFTIPTAAAQNIETALQAGVDCVVGTTGIKAETLEALAGAAPGTTTLFVAPNFTTGAVLMMAMSKLAAKFFDDAEIIEFHHNNKKDAPSGTALATARLIAEERSAQGLVSSAPGSETELPQMQGARGAELLNSGVHLHSVRSNGFVASQEVIFGSSGQTLTIRHDSFDRSSYMPGVLLAIRSVGALSGLVVGLEELMSL
ncbi:MAG: 4-hydroxy-tetrahydrodipicolinate reductase [Coriobacteriales bacterium]|jgi:4-hydroxy-tetrahydrodipicolinate reductase|nr:4-hydroxy-tetrahydrodipicolinate reductase [Coriobacteriales bacterium]